ncbi:hypothetical protein ADL27_37615 [Streptomyces sp. NRRL F-6602]|nr:hypothetical protein ADL27_37615 [Streptomyces sp. NRRL F-6602]
MPGGAPTPSKADLKRGAEALKILKKRIDGAITKLDNSAAAKHAISARRVTRKSFSGENTLFFEADDLYTKFTEVHDTLTQLSQTLRDQIDAIGIAVKGADGNFDAVDAAERRRFWQIQARTEALTKKTKPPAYSTYSVDEPEDGEKHGKGTARDIPEGQSGY